MPVNSGETAPRSGSPSWGQKEGPGLDRPSAGGGETFEVEWTR